MRFDKQSVVRNVKEVTELLDWVIQILIGAHEKFKNEVMLALAA